MEHEIDVLDALERLAELPRKEYEPAIPDLGTMLEMVTLSRIARQNRDNFANNKKLFYFRCEFCGFERSGYFVRSDPKVTGQYVCDSIYGRDAKVLSRGTICGRPMTIEEFKPIEASYDA